MRQFENLFEQALNIAIFDNVLQFLLSRHALIYSRVLPIFYILMAEMNETTTQNVRCSA